MCFWGVLALWLLAIWCATDFYRVLIDREKRRIADEVRLRKTSYRGDDPDAR